MLKRYRYRLYPTPAEQQALARAFGCARVVYNDAIATREQARAAGEGWLSDGELSRRLTQAKKAPERAWLNEVSSVVLQQALADANRTMDRRTKGGRNWDKARRRYATGHRKVRDRRVHHVQVLTHRLTSENQAVAVEDLNVLGIVRSRFGKSVRDAGWGRFLRLLRDKAAARGRTVIAVDQWTPTSQVCAVCGLKDGPKPLHVRVWQCRACAALLDRDFNAALNILLAAGLAESLNACGGDVRLRLAGAVPGEAGTHRPAAASGGRLAGIPTLHVGRRPIPVCADTENPPDDP